MISGSRGGSRGLHIAAWLLVGVCVHGTDSRAAEGPGVLSASEADADFAFQGEYSGSITVDGNSTTYGAHIVAMGKGRFRGVGYPGGLPGDGFLGGERIEGEGELKNGQVEFRNPDATAVIKDDMITIYDAGGNRLGEMAKQNRKSSTLGAKPPQGAVVLFDGTSADGFENGKLDGPTLIQGITSKHKFQNATLHLEFLLSYMPEAREQGRANSGCYVQGRYEVQILDSFGLEGRNNECGGIYSVKAPSVNMCYPPLSWQTYDIDFTTAKFDATGKKTADARMTVKHNGVTIHNNVAVPKATTAAPLGEGPEPGPLYLQDHGNPIRFRNIWLVEKP